MWRITAPILVFGMTGSPVALGVLSVASYGPLLLFSFLGGILADLLPRKAIIGIVHTLLFVLFAIVGLLAAQGNLGVGVLLVAAVIEGTLYAIVKPSMQSLVYALVPHHRLTEGVSANTSLFTTAQLTGPLFASSLLLAFSQSATLLALACCYLPIATGIAFIPMQRTPPQIGSRRKPKSKSLLREGIQAVRHPPIARLLLIVAVGSMAVEGGLRVLAPEFVTTAFGEEESAAGVVVAANAFGATMALALIQKLVSRWSRNTISAAGFAIMLVALSGYAVSFSLPVGLAFSALSGLGWAFSFNVVTATIHDVVPDGVRGRVMAVHAMALLGLRPVAGMLAASTSAYFGPRINVGVFALLCVLGIFLSRDWDRSPEDAVESRASCNGSERC